MSNNLWLITTVERSHSLVPTHGFGMGDVRPKAGVRSVYMSAATAKRHTDAFQATTPGSGQPWSPPVT